MTAILILKLKLVSTVLIFKKEIEILYFKPKTIMTCIITTREKERERERICSFIRMNNLSAEKHKKI